MVYLFNPDIKVCVLWWHFVLKHSICWRNNLWKERPWRNLTKSPKSWFWADGQNTTVWFHPSNCRCRKMKGIKKCLGLIILQCLWLTLALSHGSKVAAPDSTLETSVESVLRHLDRLAFGSSSNQTTRTGRMCDLAVLEAKEPGWNLTSSRPVIRVSNG